MTDSSRHPVWAAAMLREPLGGGDAVRFQDMETHEEGFDRSTKHDVRGEPITVLVVMGHWVRSTSMRWKEKNIGHQIRVVEK